MIKKIFYDNDFGAESTLLQVGSVLLSSLKPSDTILCSSSIDTLW